MRDVNGAGVTATEVLKDHTITAPVGVRALPIALGRDSVWQCHGVTWSGMMT